MNLKKFAEQLYQKYVPSNVREFIELTAAKKPSRRTKKYCSCGIGNAVGAVIRPGSHHVGLYGVFGGEVG